ncbi:hypothetical protein EBN15_05560 [Xanthomonas cucurbitae]|nr:hypothetical protein EBN15_05560 [Xanthomonas cucurbitae]
MRISGDWGFGSGDWQSISPNTRIGDWGLGIGNASSRADASPLLLYQSPIPNPDSRHCLNGCDASARL